MMKHKNSSMKKGSRKRKVLLLGILVLLISLTGCSETHVSGVGTTSGTRTNGEGTELVVDADGIKKCVETAYRDEDLASGELGLMLMGDNLYYWRGIPMGTVLLGNAHIYRGAGRGTAETEIAALRDKLLLFYTVDEEQNLYCLYLKCAEDGNTLSLQKTASDGSLIYDTPVPPETGAQILENICYKGYVYQQGTVSPSGELVVRSLTGELYFFDEKGVFLCSGSDGWSTLLYRKADRGLANAGDKGIYTYAAKGSQLWLSEINPENGTVSPAVEVTVKTTAPLAVYSGYDRGILISDGRSLWEYDPGEAQPERLLFWDDPDVGLEDCEIIMIGLPEDGGLYVVADRIGHAGLVYREIALED